jgi:predicted signal transduction protein with EAL and GGDEF domain
VSGELQRIIPGKASGRLRSAWRFPKLSLIGWIGVGAMAAAIGAALLCANFVYDLARQSDIRHAETGRVALRAAASEYRSLFGKGSEIDPRFVHMVEHITGLKGIKFEREPQAGSDELQPLLDANGRIAGFLTWQPDWPMTTALNRWMPLLACGALGVIGLAGFAASKWRRVRALVASEERARRAAEHDAVTGLPNFEKMQALLEAAIAARVKQQVVTLALIKLCGLDDVDDRAGHLTAAVAHIKSELPHSAMLGRAGDYEFAVIMTGDIDAAAELHSVIDAIGAMGLSAGAHAGLAQLPNDGTRIEELNRRAEVALRAAEPKGERAVLRFDPSIDAIASDHNFIRRELPRAIAAGAFDLHYQPIVASDGARIVGVEALLRWTHPERAAIGPAMFVPVAEQMGLMDELGAFVLRRALVEAKRWPGLYVSVNLSPVQVRDRAIVDLVRSVLAETGVAPSRLMLEITEGVLIDNPDEMVKRIQDLRALGVRIALDDFGSGYSNLGYLQRFPFDKLKIDKSFVAPLGKSPNASVILQAIVALGRAMGLTVLVEGVETEQQRVLLRLAGCDEMQGYLFARPAPAREIERLVASAKNSRAGRPAAPIAQKLTA